MVTRIQSNRGFTLIELVISLVMGLVVLTASMSFAVTTMRNVEGNEIREDVQRNARFVALSLERDVQSTGVGIASLPWWGSLAVRNDSIAILSVPFDPEAALVHDLDPPAGSTDPMPSGGTCGPLCLDLDKAGTPARHDLQAGDVARLQVQQERRIVIVESISDAGQGFQLNFTSQASIFGYPAGLTGDLRLTTAGTFVQELSFVTYYVNDREQLIRSDHFDGMGVPQEAILADGVQSWEVTLIFTDGDEADMANSMDNDATNDFDDIVAVRIQATLAADDPDPRVNQGVLYTRDYEWSFAPRNLTYERNRRN
jgi:prepilin-type N-terminal cleavage/methylation domain-containing protein